MSDLVTDEHAAISAICNYLEVAQATAVFGSDDDVIFSKHATSKSVAASIGRWRTELDPQTQSLAAAKWEEFLRAFGYD